MKKKLNEHSEQLQNITDMHKHTYLSLLHHVGSIQAKSRSNPSQVATDRVVIAELD